MLGALRRGFRAPRIEFSLVGVGCVDRSPDPGGFMAEEDTFEMTAVCCFALVDFVVIPFARGEFGLNSSGCLEVGIGSSSICALRFSFTAVVACVIFFFR